MILLLIPLTLFIGVYCFGGKRYYFISLLILLECMLPFFLIFEGRKPQARELVLIAVLVALNVAGRAAFFMLPEFKPVVAMTILAGVAFGGETGFLVGAMTMLVSNMLFSQGPWTPWQMFAMGSIGWLAGVLYRKGVLRRSKLSLCIFGVIASTVIFGGIMESRVGAHVVRIGQLEDHHELLHHRHSGRSGTCSRYVRLSLARRGADAGKSWTGSKQKYGLAGVSSAGPFGLSKNCCFPILRRLSKASVGAGRGFYSCPAALGMS